MPRIVDGDNLLGSWPGRRRSDPERRSLLREVGRLALRERRRIVVVFDGAPPPDFRPDPDRLFAGAGKSADDAILALVTEQEDRRGWIVVTNDRALADQCRYLGARVESCDAFRQRLGIPEDGEKPDPRLEIDHWQRVFGDEGEGPDRSGR